MLPLNHSYLYHPTENIGVIWCAKAGCTMIVKSYYHHEGKLDMALKYSSWVHDFRLFQNYKTNPIHQQALDDPTVQWIQFVRCPYARAVSSYTHLMKTNYLNNPFLNDFSFHQFLDYLIQYCPSDPHHNQQSFYLPKYPFIIKIENWKNTIKHVNSMFGLNYYYFDQSHHHNNRVINNTFVGNTAWSNIRKKIPQKYQCFYNPTIRNKVELLYHNDIINFGYSFQEFISRENKKIS